MTAMTIRSVPVRVFATRAVAVTVGVAVAFDADQKHLEIANFTTDILLVNPSGLASNSAAMTLPPTIAIFSSAYEARRRSCARP
jgi:hypothetical protein